MPSGTSTPSFTGSVTLALATNPNGATLGGTLAVNASAGVATFAGLTLDKAGTGATLRATGTGLSLGDDRCHHRDRRDGDSARGDDAPPASVTAGSGFGLVVKAEEPSETSTRTSPPA